MQSHLKSHLGIRDCEWPSSLFPSSKASLTFRLLQSTALTAPRSSLAVTTVLVTALPCTTRTFPTTTLARLTTTRTRRSSKANRSRRSYVQTRSLGELLSALLRPPRSRADSPLLPPPQLIADDTHNTIHSPITTPNHYCYSALAPLYDISLPFPSSLPQLDETPRSSPLPALRRAASHLFTTSIISISPPV